METHELCDLFPKMQGEDYQALLLDIYKNGQIQPIVTYQEKILDGYHRFRICQELKIVPKFEKYLGTEPVSYVLSLNLRRRHLEKGQIASIVSSAQNWELAHPAHRPLNNINELDKEARHRGGLISKIKDRAKIAGVSIRTQERADQLFHANPELSKKVIAGEIKLSQALKEIAPKKPEPVSEPAPEPAIDLNSEFIAQSYELEKAQDLIKILSAVDLGNEIKILTEKNSILLY